jgi:hypothetical protein
MSVAPPPWWDVATVAFPKRRQSELALPIVDQSDVWITLIIIIIVVQDGVIC